MRSVAEKSSHTTGHRRHEQQVRLRLVYVDFWSALKLSFLAAIALAAVTVVTILLGFVIVRATDAFIDAGDVISILSEGSVLLTQIAGLQQVMGFSLIVATLELVVVTVLGAVAAGVYNMTVLVTGGLPVGFTSR